MHSVRMTIDLDGRIWMVCSSNHRLYCAQCGAASASVSITRLNEVISKHWKLSRLSVIAVEGVVCE